MKLWLDVGNTRLKWQLYESDSLISEGNVVHSGKMDSAVATLSASISGTVSFVGLASVLNVEALEQLSSACLSHFGVEPLRAEVSKKLKGVVCAYEDYSRLGIDRWLAVVAAFNQQSTAVCVVDCGSALTIDMVNNAGEHMGGFILPGLNMSARALLGQTHSVRFDEEVLPSHVSLGRDTGSAVLNGVLLQAQASVREAWRVFEQHCLGKDGSGSLLVTGGDAEAVTQGLDLEFELKDDLVIQGLRLALE